MGYTKNDNRAWCLPFSKLPSFERLSDQFWRLRNLRDFLYLTENEAEATAKWKNQDIDISKLEKVDLIIAPFFGGEVAHLLLGFDFGENDYLVMSPEMLYKTGDKYTVWRVLTKFHKIGYLWGTANDFIDVRRNLRKEKLEFIDLQLKKEDCQNLFIQVANETNAINNDCQRYGFFKNSCTDKILKHLKSVKKISVWQKYRILLGPLYIKKIFQK